MKTRIPAIFLIVLTLALALFVAGKLFIEETKPRELPIYGSIGDFSLTDSSGNRFQKAMLTDKIWVADFFFTTCAGICPILTRNMSTLYRSYHLEDDVRFVSITVDPENDTPETLNRYASNHGIDTSRWHFLTGKRGDIKNLAVQSFKVGSVEEPLFHSAKFVLVDTRGNIRGYYDGTAKKDVKILFKDMAQLMRESRQ